MRFIELTYVLVIVVLTGCGMKSAYVNAIKGGERINTLMKKTRCVEYISESFRKTCLENQTEELDRWETEMKSMWELEEIQISKEVSLEGEVLYTCLWTGPFGNGEVIQGSRNEKENLR